MQHRVLAHNTAVESQNRIHADDIAQQYGFRGGLVPGVDVYAYLTAAPVERWGLDWLRWGTLAARFLQPVYDGEEVTVTAGPDDATSELQLELSNPAGQLCATGDAGLPDLRPIPPVVDAVPHAQLPDHRPRASASSLAPGTVLGSIEVGFHADLALQYLDDVRDQSPIYRRERVAHPGWLLRFANTVLAANVELGPWIHVSSDVANFAVVQDGQRIGTRAAVLDEYERKGHHFVELDVLLVADGTTPVMRARHTAIYEPRTRVA